MNLLMNLNLRNWFSCITVKNKLNTIYRPLIISSEFEISDVHTRFSWKMSFSGMLEFFRMYTDKML